ncbi:MAG: MBL fold metallo-hydrolase [Candidatus Solibacter usitatus]|nr:MBL fold metallo-hydrolase [Candidatus Solibacter usitatus]
MKQPVLKNDAFLQDVDRHTGRKGVRLWWLGQSGFLLHWDANFLLFDPYLSDSLTDKYAGTAKPHVRMTAQVVHPLDLYMVDVVASSHNHTDHLDRETLGPLRAANGERLKLVIPEANRAFVVERLECEPEWPVGMNDGEVKQVGPFEFHGIASAHEGLDRTEAGLHPYLGNVVKFGGHAVYHPGDTVLYEGLVEKLRPHHVDVAMLPINGSLPERGVAGNLWGREAAWLAKEAQVKLAIPCHFDMFAFNTVTTDEFESECRRLGQRFKVLKNGEGLTL